MRGVDSIPYLVIHYVTNFGHYYTTGPCSAMPFSWPWIRFIRARGSPALRIRVLLQFCPAGRPAPPRPAGPRPTTPRPGRLLSLQSPGVIAVRVALWRLDGWGRRRGTLTGSFTIWLTRGRERSVCVPQLCVPFGFSGRGSPGRSTRLVVH